MPDYQILLFEQESFTSIWYAIQWWASISFGLIALTRFSGKQLNLPIVIGVSIIYSLFTVFTIVNMLMVVAGLQGTREDLRALRDSGGIGLAAERLLGFREQYASVNGLIILTCVVATFAGTIAYLVYAYRKERRSS